jgi:hypothetical protein
MTEMTQAFLEFSDKAAESGLANSQSDLGQALRKASQRIMELSHTRRHEQDAIEELPKRKRARRKPSEDCESCSFPADRNPVYTSAAEYVEQLAVQPHPKPRDMLGYQMYDSEPQVLADVGFVSSTPEARMQAGWDQALMDPQSCRAQVPEAASHTEEWKEWVDQPLKPIYTYNFQETSFARRLLRYSYEQTYHLLAMPSPSPKVKERIQKVLRYSLCFTNPSYIAESIRSKLLATTKQSLEHWNMPDLHIGGAGLHFPREGIDDTVKPVQGYGLRRNIGPWPLEQAHRKEDMPHEDYPFDLARFAEVEGVWFDSYDVEQYLRTKGIHLDGQSSTAVVELDDLSTVSSSDVPFDSPRTGSTHSSSAPQSPPADNDQPLGFLTAGSNAEDTLKCMDMLSRQQTTNLTGGFPMFQDGTPTDKRQYTTPPHHFSHSFNNSRPTPPTSQKRQVVIDVDRLLEGKKKIPGAYMLILRAAHTDAVLNEDSVCLGRSPGWRVETVDAAVSTILRESW